MNIDYYSNERLKGKASNRKLLNVLFSLMAVVLFVGMISAGCAKKTDDVADIPQPAPVEAVPQEVNVPTENSGELEVSDDKTSGSMVSYDVASVGRADPFMPYGEIEAFEEAKRSAYAEANAHNARIAELQKLKNVSIREADDISPYSFNLPVPPTSLASPEAAAAKITRTKVVGIMYNKTSPSAIINVDDKDYLVRTGDKIIGQEYKVVQINPSWITVSLGSNVYSASIGELFSRDDLDKSQNDLYNLRNRFGGRKG